MRYWLPTLLCLTFLMTTVTASASETADGAATPQADTEPTIEGRDAATRATEKAKQRAEQEKLEQAAKDKIKERATHAQSQVLKVSRGDDDTMKVNAFCLNAEGDILAACGSGPGEIRVMSPSGEFLTSWRVDIKPESVGVATDGTVLVAGNGRLFRFSAEGKELHSATSPHAKSMKEAKAGIRKQVVAMHEQRQNAMAGQVTRYETMIAQLEKKPAEERNEQENRTLKVLKDNLPRMQEMAKQQAGKPALKISEEQIEQQVKRMISSKTRIASISADKQYVYVATPATQGYGYVVWRMDDKFENGEIVIESLRGCCGQMDVQACENGLFVAENSRHRVVRFDANGKQTASWGKRDRTGLDGFTSCCNPMNVCFDAAGDVYSAESNTGRIKRFSPDGKFKDFVGDVDLVPGCKNVSIAASPQGKSVYMLDITRNHIIVMERKKAAETVATEDADKDKS